MIRRTWLATDSRRVVFSGSGGAGGFMSLSFWDGPFACRHEAVREERSKRTAGNSCRRFRAGAAFVAAAPSILGRDGNGRIQETSPALGKQKALGLNALRAQFPLLEEKGNEHPLVYLDSAATTQHPRAVLDALTSFYWYDNANPAKSRHTLARRSATRFMRRRRKPSQVRACTRT